jgi:hypothetical protein
MADESHPRLVKGISLESGTAQYTYKPLPVAEHVRILKLLPGTGEICCELSVISLKHAVDCYEALSLCIGGGSKTADIKCDGKLFPIGINLYNALWTI